MASIFYAPKASPTSAGANYSSSRLYFYETGTTTPAITYQDADFAVEHEFPVEADANGVFPVIYLDPAAAYRVKFKTSADVLIYDVDPYPAITGTGIGLTDEEESAGLSVADIEESEPVGSGARYKIIGDGSSDDTTPLANALAVGYQGISIDLGSNITILTDPFVMNVANENIPPSISGQNVTFKAKSSGVLCKLENPHSAYEGFRWDGNFIFDSNALCTSAFYLHGCQDSYFGPMQFINSVGGPQCIIEGEPSYGVYYSTFIGWRAGGAMANGGDDDGFSIKSVNNTTATYVASNTFVGWRSSWNVGHGYDIDYMTGIFVGCEAEKNDGEGWNIDHTASCTFSGGYSEHNNQSFSGDNTTDGTTDTSFVTTANSNRVMIFGGRHIGAVVGDDLGGGNVILPGTGSGLNLSQTGMGFGGANAVANGLNFLSTSDIQIRASGSNKFSWAQSTDSLRSFVKHLFSGEIEIDGDINHDGSNVGFYGKAPVARPSVTWPNTATATTTLNETKANRLMAALVALGLIVTT